MDDIKRALVGEIDSLAPELFKISKYLFDNPETAYEEYKACAYLSEFLKAHDFEVEVGVGGVKTAFLARPKGKQQGKPTVAFLAEYDALPGVGHGCGHNLIASASVGAALALKQSLNQIPGSIAIVGTPAEEGGGGKIILAEAGVFKMMDVAMMFHPGRLNLPGEEMLGRVKLRVEFFGRAAHASVSPDKGINALDALVMAYNNINALRQNIRSEARIHGVITNGGDAPNIIPAYTSGLFYVRAATREYLEELLGRVKNCFAGGALASGAEYKMEIIPPSFDPIKRNPPLEGRVAENMRLLGIPIDQDDGRRGSSDIGNLSFYLPVIHLSLAIVDPETPGHSSVFAAATMSEKGQKAMLNAAKILALTAYDFLTNRELQEGVKKAFSG
ncbi:MAG: M20 family metallopeptidase [Thermodesulfobacteriota bacterium]